MSSSRRTDSTRTGSRDPASVGSSPRRIAIEAVARIEGEGAYANLVVPAMLERSGLDRRDRAFVTELVYGATRMRRACDWLVDRFLISEPDVMARAVLRIGAYQLAFLDTPPHAAVGETVAAAPRRLRGLANAVLRKVASAPRTWPDEATRLSYPDWIIERLSADLGEDAALGAMEAMNVPAEVTTRADGYIQDRASTWVADAVGAQSGELVVDLCAAPGGKSTWIARSGARVVSMDQRASRVRLIVDNVGRTGAEGVLPVVGDGLEPPLRAGCAERVLVDAPCSGMGVMRRRADARWRIEPDEPERLSGIQRALVDSAAELLAPGGQLVYSVCTMTAIETVAVAEHVARNHPRLEPVEPPGDPWTALGAGALLLPQSVGTDGMYIVIFQRV